MSMTPTGPLPAAVYWRRRAVVLLVAVVLLSFVLRACTGGAPEPGALRSTPAPSATSTPSTVPTPSTTPSATPSTTPSGTPSTTPSDTSTATGPAPCETSALTVTVETAEPSFPLTGTAGLSLAVTSSAAEACTRPVGYALTVTSGPDRIWSSEDCTPLETAGPAQTLAPGRTVLQTTDWDKTRSRPGCSGRLPDLKPGTYVLSGRLGELTAQSTTFQLG